MKLLLNFLMILLVTIFSFTAQAIDKPNIQLSAQGSIEIIPDFVKLTLEIEETGKNKTTTKNQVDKIVQQIIAQAQKLEIQPKDIKSDNLSIYPRYNWQKDKRVFIGDTVKRTVVIKLYKLDSFGELVQALSNIQITRMQQPAYGYDQLEKIKNQALVKALENAQTKAQLIAQTLNRKLGKVYQVTETANAPLPIFRAQLNKSSANSNQQEISDNLQIKPQTIKTTVNVIYLLK